LTGSISLSLDPSGVVGSRADKFSLGECMVAVGVVRQTFASLSPGPGAVIAGRQSNLDDVSASEPRGAEGDRIGSADAHALDVRAVARLGVESAGRDDLGHAVVVDVDLPAVRGWPVPEPGRFHQGVMVRADQDQIVERCLAASPPRNHMMGLTAVGGDVAAREHTSLVTQRQRTPDRRGHQPDGGAHVEHLRAGAEDGRGQVGVAAQSP